MIKLTATTVGRLASEKGIVISKSADGKLVYQSNSNEKSLARLSNTLTTGCAENVKVILPDRSAVWLNAGSSLSYPTSFAGEKTRVVNLNGEAYFEVEKDRTHPFIVKTNRQSVEVLGTHFDINAYENEASVKTTLIEGSVQVMPLIKNTNVKGTSSSAILQPKQQAILTNGSLQVENADLEEALAWINGKFVFRDESLTKIMSQVAQWYDINVKYENDVSDLTYWGSVSRTANLSSVLAYLSKTGNVSFKIQGKLVVVKKTSKK
jgi:ferric-dicitrate binding protein FerR (iron transport regulator)